jgi:hypothetical protein
MTNTISEEQFILKSESEYRFLNSSGEIINSKIFYTFFFSKRCLLVIRHMPAAMIAASQMT